MNVKVFIFVLLTVGYKSAAALITWGTPYNFNHTDETLLSNSWDSIHNGGVSENNPATMHEAVNYGYSGVTVNGVAFTSQAGNTDYWGTTGINSNIDRLLSGHKAISSIIIGSLVPGNLYQVQLVVGHDSRTTIKERQYEISFGGGDFSSLGSAPVLTRAGYGNTNPPTPLSYQGFDSYGTIMGTFIADATTQEIRLRSNTQDGDSSDDSDPALSGYVVFESAVPEPASGWLALMGIWLLSLRRRSS